MDSLDLKHAKSVLIELSKSGVMKKSDLFRTIKSHQVLDNLLESLRRDNYLIIQESKVGPKKYSISLTPKGRAVAEQLLNVEMVASQSETYEMPRDFESEFEGLSAMTHLNVLDDHIAITEHNYDGTGKDRVIMVYVKLNGRGIMRLYCDADDSYECRHTRYAWTLPSVQEMVQVQRIKGNLKE